MTDTVNDYKLKVDELRGLVLLPLTRHHMMHLPDSAAIREFIKKEQTDRTQ